MASQLILPAGSGSREMARKQLVIDTVAKSVAAIVPGGNKRTGQTINIETLAMQVSQRFPSDLNVTPDEIAQAMRDQGMDWSAPFAPGQPLKPYDGYGTPARGWNYSPNRNIAARPRIERIAFETIDQVIDSYDIALICISHIQADIGSMPIQFQPLDGVVVDVDKEIEAAKAFWRKPDGKRSFRAWLSMYLNDILRYDAGCLFKQRDLAGRLIGLRVIDGRTILPLIDYFGERPDAPAPAFLQFILGLPWDWVTENDIHYEPFTQLRGSPYGLPPIESVLLNANTDMRFQLHFLQYFTAGTLPEGIAEAPESLSSVDQIEELQEVWDAVLLGDQAKLRQIRWVPAGTKFTELKGGDFQEQFPTYLLQRTIAAYNLTPSDLGFTEDVNKSTSDTQMDTQFRISTQPRTGYLEGIFDQITQEDLGLRVQLRFDTGREKVDRLMEAQTHQIWISCGVESMDEARRDILGLPINSEEMMPRIYESPRQGPFPLGALVAVAGEVDAMTGAPVPGTVVPQQFVVPGQMEPDPIIGDSPVVPEDDQGNSLLAGKPVPNKVTPAAPPAATQPQGVVGDQDDTDEADTDALAKSTGPVAAGLVVQAADSSRVLMIQRSITDPDDPAAGTWEFPGGCLEDGEGPYDAASREWTEEVGQQLPDGAVISDWLSTNGVYHGFLYRIASESDLTLNPDPNDRHVLNPDDPDGDCIETACWWDPAHVDGMAGLRPEVQESTPWPLLTGEAMTKALKVLRQWRDSSRTRVRQGRSFRRFQDPALPESFAKDVWSALQGATTREDVDKVFAMLQENSSFAKDDGQTGGADAVPLAQPGRPGPGGEREDDLTKHWVEILAPLVSAGLIAAVIASGFANTVAPETDTHAAGGAGGATARTLEDLTTRAAQSLGAYGFDETNATKAMIDLYAESYLAGLKSGADALIEAGQSVPADIASALSQVDWDTWAPGQWSADQVSTLLGNPPDLLRFLATADSTVKGIAQTTKANLAQILAEGVDQGLDTKTITANLKAYIDDPSRVEMIARTEVNRAMTAGQIDTYRKADLHKFLWTTEAGACPVCLAIEADNPHPITDPHPPAHPRCRCSALPFIEPEAS